MPCPIGATLAAVGLTQPPESHYAIWIQEEAAVRRGDLENVSLIVTPTLDIPWPKGMTFSEALLAWRRGE